jgi:hypothetical protein
MYASNASRQTNSRGHRGAPARVAALNSTPDTQYMHHNMNPYAHHACRVMPESDLSKSACNTKKTIQDAIKTHTRFTV